MSAAPIHLDVPDGGAVGAQRFEHDAMACTWGIWIIGQAAPYAASAAAAAWAEIDRLEQELSRFVPHSDIARLNRQPVGEPLLLGPDAADCLRLAGEICGATGGAFDVTVGALLPEATGRVTAAEPVRPDAAVGGHLLRFDALARTAARLSSGVRVDLGAIGKGYAVDRAAEILRAWGITSALVHSGQSTLMALGAAPGAAPGAAGWCVGVRDPADARRELRRVRLRDEALSGSGRAMHGDHIFDARRGAAVTDVSAAWAIAPSAAVSDALSTAIMSMRGEEIDAALERLPGTAAMVLDRGASDAREHGPNRFDRSREDR